MFSSSRFTILGFMLLSFIFGWFLHIEWESPTSFFYIMTTHFSQHHLLKRLSFRRFGKNQLTIYTWVYFWAFYLVLLVDMFVLMLLCVMLLWLQQLSNKHWSQGLWCLQFCSHCSRCLQLISIFSAFSI
jgi:hypothetical protein